MVKYHENGLPFSVSAGFAEKRHRYPFETTLEYSSSSGLTIDGSRDPSKKINYNKIPTIFTKLTFRLSGVSGVGGGSPGDIV